MGLPLLAVSCEREDDLSDSNQETCFIFIGVNQKFVIVPRGCILYATCHTKSPYNAL